MTNDNNNNNENSANKDEALVEVTWSGKKIFLPKKKLEEWYDQSYEMHDDYVKEHPWVVQNVPVHKLKPMPDSNPEEADEKEEEELSQVVVVHWCGKSLLLKRDKLDEFHQGDAEQRAEYLRKHAQDEIKF